VDVPIGSHAVTEQTSKATGNIDYKEENKKGRVLKRTTYRQGITVRIGRQIKVGKETLKSAIARRQVVKSKQQKQ
jgi:hypothetical protein